MRSLWCRIAIAIGSVISSQAIGQSSVDLGFESGELTKTPSAWFVPTAGWNAALTEERAAAGSRSLRLHVPTKSDAPFGNVMRTFPGSDYAKRRVTLTAKILVKGKGKGQMLLRVDRVGGEMGAFDNMGDRPVTEGDWTDATIEVDVESDAEAVNIGFMSLGGATVYIDDVKLSASADPTPLQAPSPARALSERGVENVTAAAKLLSYVRFFHPSDQAVGVASWDHFAAEIIEQAEPASDSKELATQLSQAISEIAPTVQVWAGTPEQAPALDPVPEGATSIAFWRHLGAGSIAPPSRMNAYSSKVERTELSKPPAVMFVVKDLGGGVSCRIPLGVYANEQGTLPHGKTPEKWASKDTLLKLNALNRSTRLAGVALSWGVFQHFYPYFDVMDTDWDAALSAAISKAAEDSDEFQYLSTLRQMVAKLHDGHGNVWNASLRAASFLPLAVEWAGSDLVVVGKHDSVPDGVAVGDAIVSIDGRSAQECYAEVSKLISSATDGFARYVSARMLVTNLRTNDPARIEFRHPDGETFTLDLPRIKEFTPNTATSKRPDNGQELAPGIVYFDLNGAEDEAFAKALPKLEGAKAIVFDLRGYPGAAAFQLMQHLIDEEATSARWGVPIVTTPDHEAYEWEESGRWQLTPSHPRLKAQIAFLTDGRAISYAESIMGIVEHYKFGEIIGSATAGTNGNVNPFTLPGGYQVNWTGMKVLKHDGSKHHGVGITPTIQITATAKGIAEGRDEVLEQAIEVMKAKVESASEK